MTNRVCSVDGCLGVKYASPTGGGALCNLHYQRFKRHGDPLAGGVYRQKGRVCSIDGCGDPHVSRGLCNKHRAKWLKYGDPLYVHENYKVNQRWVEAHKDYEGDDCLKWPFNLNSNGRGTCGGRGERTSAPRAMCISAHGNPPDSRMQTAHSCGNGHLGCVNPKHLRWATHMENVKDRADHGRDRIGDQINTAKLNEQQVRHIRSQRGLTSGAKLAIEFSVSKACISSIQLGKSWKHIL